MARTRWCGLVLQLVPYVKTMVGAVMALKGACSQAVHNKERCTALAECVRVAAQLSRALCAAPNCYASMWDCVWGPSNRSRASVRPCVRGYYPCVRVRRYRVLAAECVKARGGAAGGSQGSARC
jgi:hypothetical protein